MNIINRFDGEYAFLSNFAHRPITFKGKTWSTVEHIFQAAKTLDENMREEIRIASTPDKAKRIGRMVRLRPDWEEMKKEVMLKSIRLKFSQNSELKESLLRTEDAILLEGNTWHDNIWGDCSCQKCQETEGRNLLGKILMQVRRELAGQTDYLTNGDAYFEGGAVASLEMKPEEKKGILWEKG